MSEAEYTASVLPHVREILENLPDHWWLNIVQVGGYSPMLDVFADLPIQALNWDTRANGAALVNAKSVFSFAACGGLNEQNDLLCGTPALLTSAARDAISQSESRRFILSCNGSGYINTPISNFRAVRSIVEGAT